MCGRSHSWEAKPHGPAPAINCQDRLRDAKAEIDAVPIRRSTKINALNICDLLARKLESMVLQPSSQQSQRSIIDNYTTKRCNNDTILQLQVLLLIMPEVLTGPEAGRSIAAIQQVYTTGSPFLPVKHRRNGVRLPDASRLMALCLQLNGVNKASIPKVGDNLTELLSES
jgi:hypothetical protein